MPNDDSMPTYCKNLTVPPDEAEHILWIGKLGRKEGDTGQDGVKAVVRSGSNSFEAFFRGYVMFYTDKSNHTPIKVLGRIAIRGMLEKDLNDSKKGPFGIISILGPYASPIFINNENGLNLIEALKFSLNNQRQWVFGNYQIPPDLPSGSRSEVTLSPEESDLIWDSKHLKFSKVTIATKVPTQDIPPKITIHEGIFFCTPIKVEKSTSDVAIIFPQYQMSIMFINLSSQQDENVVKVVCETQYKTARCVWGLKADVNGVPPSGPLKLNEEIPRILSSTEQILDEIRGSEQEKIFQEGLTNGKFRRFDLSGIDERRKHLVEDLKNLDNVLTGKDCIGVYLVDEISATDFGKTFFEKTANAFIVLSIKAGDSVLAHELGHVLGLDHYGEGSNPGTKGSIMDNSSSPPPCANSFKNYKNIFAQAYWLQQANDIFTMLEPTMKPIALDPNQLP